MQQKTTKLTKTVYKNRNKRRYPSFLLRGLLGWHRRFASADPTAAKHNVVLVNYCGLSGRHRALWLMQTNPCAIIFQRRHGCGCARMAVPNLHRKIEVLR